MFQFGAFNQFRAFCERQIFNKFRVCNTHDYSVSSRLHQIFHNQLLAWISGLNNGVLGPGAGENEANGRTSLFAKAGLRIPKVMRPGVDVASQVEVVGSNAAQFKPGDDVFGACCGPFGEYACISESAYVMKPDYVTFKLNI